MNNPVAALLSTAALVAAVAGPASAEPVVLLATGVVVSRTSEALVIRTDDHGHAITFAVDRSTVVPATLAVGQRVRVAYHPNGATSQTADTVTLAGSGVPQVDLLAKPDRTKPGPVTASR